MQLGLTRALGLSMMAGLALPAHALLGDAAASSGQLLPRLFLLLGYLGAGAAALLVVAAGVGSLLPTRDGVRRPMSAPPVAADRDAVRNTGHEADEEEGDEDDEAIDDEVGRPQVDDEPAVEPAEAREAATPEAAREEETEDEVAAAWKRPRRRRKSDPVEGQVGFW